MSDSFQNGLPERDERQDTDELVALLDREIDHARVERTRFGWSRWGLLLAVGGILWAALNQHASKAYALADAAAWFVLASLLADLFLDDIVQRWDVVGDPRRLRVGSYLGRRPFGLGALVFRAVLIGFAAFAARSVLSTGALFAVVSFYGLIAAFLFIILVAVLKDIPTQAGLTPGSTIVSWGLHIVALLALGTVLLDVHFPDPGHDATALSIGVLTAIATYLWVVLLGDRHRDPLLETLVDIRRDLILREADFSTAMRRTLVALRGLAFSDWVQRDVQELEELYQRVVGYDKTIFEMAELCGRDFDLLAAGRSSNIRETVLAVRGRLDAMEVSARDMKASYKRISEIVVELAGKVGSVSSMDPSLSQEAIQIEQAVDPLADDAMDRSIRIDVQLPGLIAQARSQLQAYE